MEDMRSGEYDKEDKVEYVLGYMNPPAGMGRSSAGLAGVERGRSKRAALAEAAAPSAKGARPLPSVPHVAAGAVAAAAPRPLRLRAACPVFQEGGAPPVVVLSHLEQEPLYQSCAGSGMEMTDASLRTNAFSALQCPAASPAFALYVTNGRTLAPCTVHRVGQHEPRMRVPRPGSAPCLDLVREADMHLVRVLAAASGGVLDAAVCSAWLGHLDGPKRRKLLHDMGKFENGAWHIAAPAAAPPCPDKMTVLRAMKASALGLERARVPSKVFKRPPAAVRNSAILVRSYAQVLRATGGIDAALMERAWGMWHAARDVMHGVERASWNTAEAGVMFKEHQHKSRLHWLRPSGTGHTLDFRRMLQHAAVSMVEKERLQGTAHDMRKATLSALSRMLAAVHVPAELLSRAERHPLYLDRWTMVELLRTLSQPLKTIRMADGSEVRSFRRETRLDTLREQHRADVQRVRDRQRALLLAAAPLGPAPAPGPDPDADDACSAHALAIVDDVAVFGLNKRDADRVRAEAADRRELKEFQQELEAAAAPPQVAAAAAAVAEQRPSQGWDASVSLVKRVFVRPGANGVAEVMVVFTVDRTPELTRMRLRLQSAALSGGVAEEEDEEEEEEDSDEDAAAPAAKRARLALAAPAASSLTRHLKAAMEAVRRFSMPDGRRPAAKWSEALLGLEKDLGAFSTYAHFALALSGAVQSDDRVVQAAVHFFAHHHCKIAKCEAKLARRNKRGVV